MITELVPRIFFKYLDTFWFLHDATECRFEIPDYDGEATFLPSYLRQKSGFALISVMARCSQSFIPVIFILQDEKR